MTRLVVDIAAVIITLSLRQNVGIAAVLGGYTFQRPDLAFAGVLLVASALWASSGRIPAMVPAIEVPLLASGLLSLASLGVVYTIV
ncbi:MAG: hypothetical protein ACE5FR_03085 [Rhodospirillales bacterium]